MTVGLLIGLVVGLCAGIAIGLVLRARSGDGAAAEAKLAQGRLADSQGALGRVSAQCEQASAALAQTQADNARLSAELDQARRSAAERTRAWEEDRDRLVGTFAQLSNEALRTNTEQFLTLADARLKETHEAARGDLGQRQEAISQLLQPVKDLLGRYEAGLRQMELERKGAYSGLTEQVQQLVSSQDQLKKETQNLVTALRAPQTRGRWGEMQLRRVVEMAGMVAHCDFDEQVTTSGEDGRLRPDLVVHLPGGAHVVVDAKVPLDAFLRATEAEDDATRQTALVAHARQLRTHIDQLSKREYWRQFDPSPDYVIAFVPGDPLLDAAFEQDGSLIEHAMASRVLITTPTTLIALLRDLRPGLARRGDGRERAAGQGPRHRPLRPAPGARRPLRQDASEPHQHRRGVQRRRGLARVAASWSPPVGSPTSRSWATTPRRWPSCTRSRRRRGCPRRPSWSRDSGRATDRWLRGRCSTSSTEPPGPRSCPASATSAERSR